MKRGFFRDASHPSAFLAVIACGAGLWSCDVNDKQASESSLARLAAGDSLEFRLPTRDGTTESASLEFAVDSGKTYTVAWSDPGPSVAMSVTAAAGDAPYQELSTDVGGFEHAIRFPATKTGNLKLVATGVPGAAFQVGLRARDGFPIPVALPDSFEYDDLRQGAQPLKADGSWQRHTSTTSGRPDVDWMRFDVDSGNVYAVVREDSLLAGATMSLFTADSLALDGRSFVANRKARLYCRVAAPSGRGGYYRIRLEVSKGLPAGYLAPDRYESDNTLATASALPLDSSWQDRTLPVSGKIRDVDLIRIDGDSGRTYRIYFRPSDTNYSAASARIIGPDSIPEAFKSSIYRHNSTFIAHCGRRGPFFVEVKDNGYATSYRIAAVAADGLPDWAVSSGTQAGRDKLSAPALGTDSVQVVKGWLLGDDTGWVKLETDAERFYAIEPNLSTALSGGRNFGVEILDSAGSSVRTFKSGSSGTILVPSGFHGYLRIAPDYSRSLESIGYAVTVKTMVPPADPREPNNSLSTASPIPVDGSRISGWISYEDPDWMSIKVDSGRRIAVNLTGSVYGDLYTRDSASVGRAYGGTSAGYGWVDYLPQRNGTVYLKVQGMEGFHPYSLWIDKAGADSMGSCGSVAEACQIESDSVAAVKSYTSSSQYFFRLRTTAGTTYRIETQTNGSSSLFIVSPVGQALRSSALLNGDDFYRGYYLASASDEIVVSASVSSWGNSDPRYFRMRVSEVRDASDEGGMADAADLAVNGAATNGMLILGDADFLKFHVDSGSVYSIAVKGDDSVAVGILSSDSSQKVGMGCAPGVESKLRFQADQTGTWYAGLHGGTWSPETNWSVSLVGYPKGTSRVDTSRSNAMALVADGKTSMRSLVVGDADWYSLQADSGVSYRLILESDQSLVVSTYAADGSDLGNSTYFSQAEGSGFLDLRQSYRSRVYFRISNWSPPSDVREPIRYSLRLENVEKVSP